MCICTCIYGSACECGCTHTMVCMWRSENSSWDCPWPSTSFGAGFLSISFRSSSCCAHWELLAHSSVSMQGLQKHVMASEVLCGVWGWVSGAQAWAASALSTESSLQPYDNYFQASDVVQGWSKLWKSVSPRKRWNRASGGKKGHDEPIKGLLFGGMARKGLSVKVAFEKM